MTAFLLVWAKHGRDQGAHGLGGGPSPGGDGAGEAGPGGAAGRLRAGWP